MRSVKRETWGQSHAAAYLARVDVAEHVWILCFQDNTLTPVARVVREVEHAMVTP